MELTGNLLQAKRARIAGGRELAWWLGLFAALVALLLLNPAGFIGGGQDDWQYLNAARCWREYGPCLPNDHWQARWPVVAPIAAITALFGESRLTLAIAPLLASGGALVLLALIGNRLFGPPIGWIASLLLLSIPAFTLQLAQPSVEATELAFIFAGFLAILQWQSKRQPLWAFLAGLAFALAFQVRETSVIAAVLALAFVIARPPRAGLPALAWAAAGFALPLAVEFIVFAIETGDPFWRRGLALNHTSIPSSELAGGVSTGASPLFNVENIANWRKQPGLEIHWTVDGIVNLFVNVLAGISLLAVPLVLLVSRSALHRERRRQALILWIVALIYVAVLIYVFAIDPKPRVMLAPLTLSTVALALLSWALHQNGRKAIAYGIWGAALLVLVPAHASKVRMQVIEAPAAAWLERYGGRAEMDGNTRRYLALVPAARELPGLDGDRAYLLFMSPVACSQWISAPRFPHGTFDVVEHAPVANAEASGELCLLRYRRRVPGDEVRSAILTSASGSGSGPKAI